MISGYAGSVRMREGGSFGTHFQVGSLAETRDAFYCIYPKNGDKAYIYHFIDNVGKITRICSGDDCGQYITGETCFATFNNCTSGGPALSSGCYF